jgi:hypothetical protein
VVFSGSELAAGSAGFGRCVSAGPLLLPGIVAELSIATTSALPPGSVRCNSAAAPAADENAARILSANTAASAADLLLASACLLDFRDDL